MFNEGVSDEGPHKKVAADGHEYHVSKNANAAVAPTNEATLENVTKQGELTDAELEFVTLVHYEWGLTGEIDHQRYVEEYLYTQDEVRKLFSTPEVTKALVERGIPEKRLILETTDDTKPSAVGSPLTPVQLVVANTMLDLMDTRSDKKKLTDMGVTTAQYQMWLRDANFTQYLRERAERMFPDVGHEALLSLMDRVRGGDMKAITMYMEMTGRFVSQASQQSNGAAPQHDMTQMVVRIVEIILEEVDDPQTAARIGDRLKALVAGNQVAGLLPAPESVVVPEIAPAREVTPEVQVMMDKGLGYNQ